MSFTEVRYELGDAIATLAAHKIKEIYDPVEDSVWGWGIEPSYEQIAKCVESADLLQIDAHTGMMHREMAKYNHSARIAYFVLNPPLDAIAIEMSLDGHINIEDGNHRLAAAIFANREIKAILSGSIEGLENVLNVKFPQE